MKTILVSLAGLLTTIICVAILVWVELRFGWAIYSYTFWFVIPAGAICCGGVSASGYLLGSRVLNYRPSRMLLGVILAVSATELFLIDWIEYALMEVDGRSVSSIISFSKYLSITLSHYSMQLGVRGHFTGDAFNIGSGGYFFAVVQVIGFVLGGFAIYWYLRSLAYCEQCSLYLTKKGTQTRYFKDKTDMTPSVDSIFGLLRTNDLQSSIFTHAQQGSTNSTGATFQSSIEVKHCKGCEKHWLKFVARVKQKSEWKDIDGLGYSAYSLGPLTLPTHDFRQVAHSGGD